jgi:hypothetical protein
MRDKKLPTREPAKSVRSPDKPQRYHPNSKCKEYIRDLAAFALPRIGGPDIVKNVAAKVRALSNCRELLRDTGDADSWLKKGLFERSPQKHLDDNRQLEKWASDLVEAIRKSDRLTDDGRQAVLERFTDLYVEKRRWNNVLNFVALFGVDALRIDPVIEELRRLEHQVRVQSLRERQESHRRLKEIMGSLFPDNRGKRANTLPGSLSKVKLYYYEELFRLYHVENTLRTFPGSLRSKVKAASENYELSVETIKDLWKLDDSYTSVCSPVSRKEMARILTARHFSITQHRVSNILAS